MVEVLQMIFESPCGFPSLEELVLSDLFRNIDLREMRGSCVPVSYKCGSYKSIRIQQSINFAVIQAQPQQLNDEPLECCT